MKSATSFFNITALRKDVTRFAPVWALYLIGGLLISLNMAGDYGSYGSTANALSQTIGPFAIINIIYALLNAQLLFGDLFNNKLCNALHALPLRREGWFFTHVTAGMAFSVVPNTIIILCLMPYMGGFWFVGLFWLLGMTLEYLFFFGLAVLGAVSTGNRFAMAAVYGLINFLAAFIQWFLETFYMPLLYGLHLIDEAMMPYCPVAWLMEREEFLLFAFIKGDGYSHMDSLYEYRGLGGDWLYLSVLAVLGVAFLGLGLLLYRKRRLESAGDFLAFRPMEPVFSVIFTLCVGAFFQMAGGVISSDENYVYMIVGIVVGYFTGQMLLQRTVRVFRKKAFLRCAAIGGLLVLSLVLTWLDVFGITSWTPRAEQVQSVTISGNYYFTMEEKEWYQHYTTSDPEQVEGLIRVHAQILQEGETYDYQYNTDDIHLTYKMKDGREINRRYYYRTTGKAAELLDGFLGSPQYVLGYTDWDAFVDSVDSIYIDGFSKVFGAEAKELLEAIKADCEAGTMNQNQQNYRYYVALNDGDGYYREILISPSSVNACAWLDAYAKDHWFGYEPEEW